MADIECRYARLRLYGKAQLGCKQWPQDTHAALYAFMCSSLSERACIQASQAPCSMLLCMLCSCECSCVSDVTALSLMPCHIKLHVR